MDKETKLKNKLAAARNNLTNHNNKYNAYINSLDEGWTKEETKKHDRLEAKVTNAILKVEKAQNKLNEYYKNLNESASD